MWYLSWILWTLFACSLGIISALVIEHADSAKAGNKNIN